MPIASIYRQPTESARHRQLIMSVNEYLLNFDKLMQRPTRTYAERARRALMKLKKSAHKRGIEILELYAPTKNKGKQPINRQRYRRYAPLERLNSKYLNNIKGEDNA